MMPRTVAPARRAGTLTDPASSALRADCAQCFALCCVALPFTASTDFAIDKQAGTPCTHLRADFGCGIHDRLRERGFPGCAVYECFGAGQKVSQDTFRGHDWRRNPESAREMFAVFPVMRQLHELLRYLAEAAGLAADADLRDRLRHAYSGLEAATRGTPAELLGVDVTAVRDEINPLLLETSERVRAAAAHHRRRRDHRGADLFGARLRGSDLRAASLRGACLVASDLRGADLRTADLIGADLRDADLRGADLTDALFLTRPQADAARGDSATRLPRGLARPAHWER